MKITVKTIKEMGFVKKDSQFLSDRYELQLKVNKEDYTLVILAGPKSYGDEEKFSFSIYDDELPYTVNTTKIENLEDIMIYLSENFYKNGLKDKIQDFKKVLEID
jgi:hypothetical protein